MLYNVLAEYFLSKGKYSTALVSHRSEYENRFPVLTELMPLRLSPEDFLTSRYDISGLSDEEFHKYQLLTPAHGCNSVTLRSDVLLKLVSRGVIVFFLQSL